jgi:hypothetical protein
LSAGAIAGASQRRARCSIGASQAQPLSKLRVSPTAPATAWKRANGKRPGDRARSLIGRGAAQVIASAEQKHSTSRRHYPPAPRVNHVSQRVPEPRCLAHEGRGAQRHRPCRQGNVPRSLLQVGRGPGGGGRRSRDSRRRGWLEGVYRVPCVQRKRLSRRVPRPCAGFRGHEPGRHVVRRRVRPICSATPLAAMPTAAAAR